MIYRLPLPIPASEDLFFAFAASKAWLFIPSCRYSFVIDDDRLSVSFSIDILLVLISQLKISGLKTIPNGESAAV